MLSGGRYTGTDVGDAASSLFQFIYSLRDVGSSVCHFGLHVLSVDEWFHALAYIIECCQVVRSGSVHGKCHSQIIPSNRNIHAQKKPVFPSWPDIWVSKVSTTHHPNLLKNKRNHARHEQYLVASGLPEYPTCSSLSFRFLPTFQFSPSRYTAGALGTPATGSLATLSALESS